MNFEELLALVRPSRPSVVAVAAAEDDVVLKAVNKAFEMEIAVPILCGNNERIQGLAKQNSIDISKFEIVESTTEQDSARQAVGLVRQGRANMLMKGLLQTSDLLKAVLDRENGLRSSALLSHVSILYSPALNRTLLLSDAAMVPYPDLKTKVEIIRNSVKAARGMGMLNPKVAVLAAVEVINPDMQATIDAACLRMMNHRGQINDCVIDGPLAMDLAISQAAVEHKNVVSDVAGAADILIFHNIEAANSALKTFTIAGECLFGGIIMGAAAPIILTSRSDSDQSKLYSIACAASICQ